MADTDVWALSPITTPAAADRIPIATAPLVGGYSSRSDFVYKNGSGQYLIPVDGNAAALALAFAADLDTGFYRGASGTIGVNCDGADKIFFAPNGIGVGTYVPTVPVHIQAPDQGQARLRIHNTAVGGHAYDIVAGLHDAAQSGMSIYDVTAGQSLLVFDTTYVRPGNDNAQSCGTAGARFTEVRAVNGAIITSDAEDKEWLGGFTPTEFAAAKRIAGEIGAFRWLSEIASKGDDARTHFGVRAQAVWAIMADEGLIDPVTEGVDPSSKYAFLCWDQLDEGELFGVRTDQLALFLIAAQEARIAALEAA